MSLEIPARVNGEIKMERRRIGRNGKEIRRGRRNDDEKNRAGNKFFIIINKGNEKVKGKRSGGAIPLQ